MPKELVRAYADRFGLFTRYPRAKERLFVQEASTLAGSLDVVERVGASVYGLDSVQRLAERDRDRSSLEVATAHGNRCDDAKAEPRASILVNHGTKDGDLSGSLALQHAVSAVFLLEFFDPTTGETLPPKYRQDLVRITAAKNRFAFQ